MSTADPLARHAVTVRGPAEATPLVFAHGFGCDQSMWRLVAPGFADRYRVVTFDFAGAGGSDPGAYDELRHSRLDGYAADLLDVVRELDLHDVVVVGHSVAAIIGALATIAEPERFAGLVMVGPSPRYLDDDGYTGGFSREDIDDLLGALASNFLGWSATMAPAIVGNPDRPELGHELTESFCRMDPAVARRFAQATFLADNRADLPLVPVPALVLQCREDIIAPLAVGAYVAEQVPDATLVVLDATGHCPQLSAPEQSTAAIRAWLDDRVAA
ncbi:alpha/beta fold hydrolase [Nocardioides marmotae]|uniref:alpha/beta fold hydrolase n=1 Tax=Nocardioides marmotae TaxID=2663857 RepID=UPI0012B668B7|nr:alpha/beta hydrolase [Nocardioides marmotae]MBC9735053.1 alpha/beta hydrolase [Nocardioides marmotae]MTB86153.1 alpha/beta fold hydrolase [Nocardioides marmotae]